MGSKTPVSILQEMMTRQGNPPKYDLIYDGGGTHEALFKYRVYADRVTAIGTGRSKKEAKQEAARSALERLAQNQIRDTELPAPQESIEVESPYKDQLQENAVGALHDFCSLYDIPLPEYELVNVEGPPHARIFTFVCSISKQKELGVGRTKKQAKQLAANNMLARMKQSLSGLVDLDECLPCGAGGGAGGDGDAAERPSEQCREAIARYLECAPSPRKKVKLNKCPAQYHRCLEEAPTDAVSHIQALQLPPLSVFLATFTLEGEDSDGPQLAGAPAPAAASNWAAELTAAVKLLQLQLCFDMLPCHRKGQVLVAAHVSSVPETVAPGFGLDEEQARQQAALLCLMQLKVFTRPVRGSGAQAATTAATAAATAEPGAGQA